MALGDFNRAMEYAEEGLEFTKKVGYMYWSGGMMTGKAGVYMLTGDLEKARVSGGSNGDKQETWRSSWSFYRTGNTACI